MKKFSVVFSICVLVSTVAFANSHLSTQLLLAQSSIGVVGAPRAFAPDILPGVAMMKGRSKDGKRDVVCGLSAINGCGLTAGHCIDEMSADHPIEVIWGTSEDDAKFKTTVMRDQIEVIGNKMPHKDLAVVKFKTPPPSSLHYSAEKLATKKELGKDLRGGIVGFGHNRTEEVPKMKDGKPVIIDKKPATDLVDTGAGTRRGGYSNVEGLGKIGAKGFEADPDVDDRYLVTTRGPQLHSYGDSGSPIMINGVIAGVYSAGTGPTLRGGHFLGPAGAAADELKYAAYTYVPDHVDEIKKAMKKLGCEEHTVKFQMTAIEQMLSKHLRSDKGKGADENWLNDLPAEDRKQITAKLNLLLNPTKGEYKLGASRKKDATNFEFDLEIGDKKVTMNFNTEKTLLTVLSAK